MPTSKWSRWIKPLKRSEKVRLRKYIEKRRKESETFHQLQGINGN
jgi:hypothetical protein